MGCRRPVETPLCAYCGCDDCCLAAEEVEDMKVPEVRIPGHNQVPARVEVPKMLARLPNVAELLCQPIWDGGEVKEEQSAFVFVGQTLVKVLVKVGCPPLKLMVQGRSWDEAWASLELILKGDDVPWEQDTPRSDKPSKKKK
jgi:hypothetical protein